MLGFFRRRKVETIHDLVSRQEYGRALDLIRAELAAHPGDRRLRLQLADVLLLAGQQDEAVGRLEVLADELAGAGFASQSIAILRRIKSLTPLRGHVDEKLNHLLHPGFRRPAEKKAPASARSPAPARVPPGLPLGVPIGSERVPDPEEIRPMTLDASEPPPWIAPPLSAAADALKTAPPAPVQGPDDHVELFDEESPFFFDPGSGAAVPPGAADQDDAEIEISVEEDLEEYVRAEPVTRAAVLSSPGAPTAVLPPAVLPRIFANLPREAMGPLLEVLPRERYEGGELVVSEGEAGTCVYAIERGEVRIYVKARDGRNTFLRALSAGDVFGEIAALTRKKRTATVVTSGPCELVRIDRETLDHIASAHPGVQGALFACFDERASDPAERALRGKASRRTIPGRRKPPARPRKRTKKAN